MRTYATIWMIAALSLFTSMVKCLFPIDPVEQSIVSHIRRSLHTNNNTVWPYEIDQHKGRRKRRMQLVNGPGPIQTNCAWSVTVTAATYNVAFPDLNCVYQVLVYWGIKGGHKMLKIEGYFPKVRYFSYQSYDLRTGRPIASLVDYEIEPKGGSLNPFQEKVSEDYDPRRHKYQLHITDTGRKGLQNELAATSRRCRGVDCTTVVILRLYTSEIGQDAFHGETDTDRLWGYVPPPVVRVGYGTWSGRLSGHTIKAYQTLEQCDKEKTTFVKSLLDWKVPQIQNKDWTEETRLDNVDDNFVVFTPKSSARALFPNADANYLFATARNNRTSNESKKELVARITGHLPLVPSSYNDIADYDTYEARYVSLSSIALKGAGPVIDTIMDSVIEEKYSKKGYEWDRSFAVVAAPGQKFLSKCPPSIYREETDLFMKTVERGLKYAPKRLAFLYRQILSTWQVSGYKDRSIARAKYECQTRQDNACQLRRFFVELMGKEYPSIHYYYCWRNETRGCSCEDSEGQSVPWHAVEQKDKNEENGDFKETRHFLDHEASILTISDMRSVDKNDTGAKQFNTSRTAWERNHTNSNFTVNEASSFPVVINVTNYEEIGRGKVQSGD